MASQRTLENWRARALAAEKQRDELAKLATEAIDAIAAEGMTRIAAAWRSDLAAILTLPTEAAPMQPPPSGSVAATCECGHQKSEHETDGHAFVTGCLFEVSTSYPRYCTCHSFRLASPAVAENATAREVAKVVCARCGARGADDVTPGYGAAQCWGCWATTPPSQRDWQVQTFDPVPPAATCFRCGESPPGPFCPGECCNENYEAPPPATVAREPFAFRERPCGTCSHLEREHGSGGRCTVDDCECESPYPLAPASPTASAHSSDIAATEKTTAKTGRWRAGRSVFRTLYVDDKLVGLVDTPELARAIVERMNATTNSKSDLDEVGTKAHDVEAVVERVAKALLSSDLGLFCDAGKNVNEEVRAVVLAALAPTGAR